MSVVASLTIPLALLIGAQPASAATYACMHYQGENIKASDTRTWVTQRASNTWEDWIFRGPEFRCPTTAPSCSYAWGQTKSTAYNVGLMGMVGVQGNPATLLAQALPSWSRTTTYTTSFTYTTTLRPGQYAQPIQVVVRRWTQGKLENYWHYDPNYRSCGNRPGSDYRGYVKVAGPATWTGNIEERRYDTYHQRF
ncbi:hypothetical protein [Micromonospora sp. KC721]|uniref:hypothetical protein n=1 Tax=Micromonospora sp. KC721 TaxID=2530380 RepID=UPI0010D184AF|nr:hypothetical protein [Micromonospora sp. KC721]TDB71315.1 hypothetical protein E1182_25390 [Micromonospora sp. KC721]